MAELTQAGLVRVDRDRVIATACGLVVADRLPLSVCGLKRSGQANGLSPRLEPGHLPVPPINSLTSKNFDLTILK